MGLWWGDILFLIVMAYYSVMGFRRGFIRSVLDLVGLYVATVFAMRYGEATMMAICDFSGIMIPYPRAIGFLIVWVLTFLFVFGLGVFLDRLFYVTFMGPLNFFSGGFFGACKGLVLVLPIVLTILFLKPTWLENSLLVDFFRPQLNHLNQKLFSEDNVEFFAEKLGYPDFLKTEDASTGTLETSSRRVRASRKESNSDKSSFFQSKILKNVSSYISGQMNRIPASQLEDQFDEF